MFFSFEEIFSIFLQEAGVQCAFLCLRVVLLLLCLSVRRLLPLVLFCFVKPSSWINKKERFFCLKLQSELWLVRPLTPIAKPFTDCFILRGGATSEYITDSGYVSLQLVLYRHIGGGVSGYTRYQKIENNLRSLRKGRRKGVPITPAYLDTNSENAKSWWRRLAMAVSSNFIPPSDLAKVSF